LNLVNSEGRCGNSLVKNGFLAGLGGRVAVWLEDQLNSVRRFGRGNG
jgi:hypothetical protein